MRRGAWRVSLARAQALAEACGACLDWVDVTEFGDREPMVVITTPRCEYCGRLRPGAACRYCGAGPREDRP